jgi:hypothetical protein
VGLALAVVAALARVSTCAAALVTRGRGSLGLGLAAFGFAGTLAGIAATIARGALAVGARALGAAASTSVGVGGHVG